MKSLAELQAIKNKMKDKVVLREGSGDVRVVVGMATCGIAAGARPSFSIHAAVLLDSSSLRCTRCCNSPMINNSNAISAKINCMVSNCNHICLPLPLPI